MTDKQTIRRSIPAGGIPDPDPGAGIQYFLEKSVTPIYWRPPGRDPASVGTLSAMRYAFCRPQSSRLGSLSHKT